MSTLKVVRGTGRLKISWGSFAGCDADAGAVRSGLSVFVRVAQTDNSNWEGVVRVWCRVAPLFLLHGVQEGKVPTGVNLIQYGGLRITHTWHCDNEPLFGQQNSPMLIVSASLGYSVEFQVRRRSLFAAPSPFRLDHGDLLMGGLAQPEYVHRTVSGLEGPRVNLPFR